MRFNFSVDTNLINLAKLLTATTLTSHSASFNKFENIYINDESAISFPTASANYKNFIYILYTSANIFDNANLTLHDLSSADYIINGNILVLFSALFNILAIFIKLSIHNNLT